jgi:hypothetical protein
VDAFRRHSPFVPANNGLCDISALFHARHVVCTPGYTHFNDRAHRPHGDKSYTAKQKRKEAHIEEGYQDSGVSAEEAAARAWATVNREDGGGKGEWQRTEEVRQIRPHGFGKMNAGHSRTHPQIPESS